MVDFLVAEKELAPYDACTYEAIDFKDPMPLTTSGPKGLCKDSGGTEPDDNQGY